MSARLFVAVALADDDRAALAAWAAEAVGEDPGMRLVDPAQVHLTMAVLGHRPLDEVDPLRELVARHAGPRPPMATAGALWLSPRRPHVLTVAIDDRGGVLEALYGRLWDDLEETIGVQREKRRFKPHVTVARVRRGWTAPSRRLPEAPARELTGEALVLFRSYLGGRGPARYEAVERVALG